MDANEENIDVLLPDISQHIGLVFRHEEDLTFADGDGKCWRFGFIREFPSSHSNDEFVFARSPPLQGRAR